MTPNPAETLPALQSQPLLQQSAPSQFFGDPTGPQMAALGQGLVSAARTATYLQDKLDESQARDMTIELGKLQGSLLVDPDKGYLWTKGQNALQARPQALEAFSNRVQELEDQLQTRRAKQLFRQQAGLRQIEFQQRIDAHAGREAEEYETQSRAAALDQYAQEAIDSYGLPGIAVPDPQNPGAVIGGQPNQTSKVRQDLALQEFDAMAAAKGVAKGSPLYKQLRTEVTNKIAVGITERLMAQDPAKAWKYLQSVPTEDMTSESRRKLLGQVQEHADTAIGISTAGQLLQTFQEPELAQQKLRELMLQNPGAMTPAAFDRARQEIEQQGKAAEGIRKNIENRIFEGAKQYVLENPGTRFDGLPEPLRKGLTDSFQRDDFETWVSKEGKVETNPVVAAGLGMQPASWWKQQTLESFARDYQRHLAPNDFERLAKLIGVGPQAENERNVTDLDMIAAQDAGIVDKDEKLADDPEAAARFMRFQVRVDQLSEALAEDERDPVARRQMARSRALSEKVGEQYRWELSDAQRAETPIKIEGYDDTINVSRGFGGVSRAEMDETLAQLGQRNPRSGEIVRKKLAQYREQLASNQDYKTDEEREMAAQEAVKADLLTMTTETEVVTTILERRKKAQAVRKAEREALSNEIVDWDTLERQGIIKSRDDEMGRILAGKSLASVDDIAREIPWTGYVDGVPNAFGYGVSRFSSDRTGDLATSEGLSRAAVERMLKAHTAAVVQTRVAQGAQVPVAGAAGANQIMSPAQRQKAIERFERMHEAATVRAMRQPGETAERVERDVSGAERRRLQRLQSESAQQGSGFQMNVEWMQQAIASGALSAEDPRVQALMAQQSLGSLPVGPSRLEAEAAWEAWLQNGGAKWEKWEQAGKPKELEPSAKGLASWSYSYDLHKKFRDKIASVLGRVPGSSPAGQ